MAEQQEATPATPAVELAPPPIAPVAAKPAPIVPPPDTYDPADELDDAPAAAPEPAATQPAAAPVSHKHPRSQLNLALAFGLTAEEAAARTPEQLDDVLTAFQETSRRRSTQSAAPQPEVDAVIFPDDDGKELLDPKVAKFLHEQNKRVKHLESQLAQQIQAKTGEQITQECDAAFEKHKSHLGEGKGHELKRDSKDFIRRKAVLDLVDSMPGNASLQTKIDRAVETLYGTPPEAAELEKTRREWQEGTVARPTQRRNAAEPNGRAKAIKGVEDWFKRNGDTMTESADDDFE